MNARTSTRALVAERRVVDLHRGRARSAPVWCTTGGRRPRASSTRTIPEASSLTACEPWLPPRIDDRARVAGRAARRRPPRVRGTLRRTGLPTKRTLRRAKRRGRVVERDEHAPHQPPQHAVGEARDAVLLLDRRRVAAQRGRQHQRPRRVAAHAQHDVGPVAPQDARATRGTRPAAAPARAACRRRPMRLSPLTVTSSSGKPAAGTSLVSRPRAVPTNTRLAAGRRPHLLGDRRCPG